MRLIGVKVPDNPSECVGLLTDDRVWVLVTKDEFWAQPRQIVQELAKLHDGLGLIYCARKLSQVTQVPIVPAGARVLCVGLNYRAHATEGGFSVPAAPTIFGRWTSSLSVGDVAVPIPTNEPGLDWEGEIVAYVGSTLADADADTAREAVLGYSTFNDITARTAQKLTSQWTLGKNADKSGPLGPLVAAHHVGDLRKGLRIQTRVNGQTVQDANTASMIFEVGELLSLISHTMTLHPGDIIATGTPEGVGYVRTPPWLLTDGDVVEVEVDRLGVLRTPVGGTR